MRLLSRLLDAGILVFAAWTLGYQVTLWLRLPAAVAYVAWIPFFSIGLVFCHKKSRKIQFKQEARHFFTWLALSVPFLAWLGTSTIYDADNFSFFHRALWQTSHLSDPIAMNDPSVHDHVVPAISAFHVSTSQEMLSSFLAHALRIDPIWTHMTFIPLLVCSLVVASILLLARYFRLNYWSSIAFVVFFGLACLLDGNVFRSIGAFGLLRLSEGKAILALWYTPLVVLQALRHFRSASPATVSLVLATCICGVGWSSTGIFVVPASFGITALAFVLGGKSLRNQFRNAVSFVSPSIYAILVLYFSQRLFPWKLGDTGVWDEGWPKTWIENVGMIARQPNGFLLMALTLGFAGFFFDRATLRRRISLLAVVPLILIFNPVAGPFFLNLVKPAAFWRLGYLESFPLGLGLLGSRLLAKPGLVRWTMSAAFLIFHLVAGLPFIGQGSIVRNPIPWGSVRLDPQELSDARIIAPLIKGKSFLASEKLACILLMVDPNLDAVSVRPAQTTHTFSNGGLASEGRARAELQLMLSGESKVSVIPRTDHDPNLLIVAKGDEARVRNLWAGRIESIISTSTKYLLVSVK